MLARDALGSSPFPKRDRRNGGHGEDEDDGGVTGPDRPKHTEGQDHGGGSPDSECDDRLCNKSAHKRVSSPSPNKLLHLPHKAAGVEEGRGGPCGSSHRTASPAAQGG